MVVSSILKRVDTVLEFKDKLLELKGMRSSESSSYFLASLEADYLLRVIDREESCMRFSSMKFVVYPNGSGVDLFIGEDIEELSEKFGWEWRELSND